MPGGPGGAGGGGTTAIGGGGATGYGTYIGVGAPWFTVTVVPVVLYASNSSLKLVVSRMVKVTTVTKKTTEAIANKSAAASAAGFGSLARP
mmetsp:Transcript_1178/g.2541  ORF Transcript_1178/g.2541 Transcript_1178/m.2541 type:complete len:91 (-) Transcript_1178:40-312(-)